MQSVMPSTSVATDRDEQAVLARFASCLKALQGQNLGEEQAHDLRSYLEMVPDPRDHRGRRHPLSAVLFLACAAMLTGKVSIAAIARWMGGAGQTVWALAGARRDRRTGAYVPPSEPTLRRILSRTDGDALDRALGAFLFSHLVPIVARHP